MWIYALCAYVDALPVVDDLSLNPAKRVLRMIGDTFFNLADFNSAKIFSFIV